MATPRLKDRVELLQEWIRRFVSYSDEITWFGDNSVMRAMGAASAGLAENGFNTYVAVLRRFTVMSGADEELAVTCSERGVDKAGANRSKVLVVVNPVTVNVTAITLGATDLIEVDDSSEFLATDSIRIRNGDGTLSEIRTIIAITSGTGPNLGDELEVAALANTYSPTTDDVDVLFRAAIADETRVTNASGVEFDTIGAVTTGDSNPVLDGESQFLGLADKVWAEAVNAGASGDIDARTITGFSAGAIRGVSEVLNPERGTGGADEESDFALKARTINGPAEAAQETEAWFEALAKRGNSNVLRVVRPTDTALSTMIMRVLHRNGGLFSSSELADLEAYMNARVRSGMVVQLENVVLTAVEVEAQITIDSTTTLETVWRDASTRLAEYLDYRKRNFGDNVDFDELRQVVEQTPGIASVDSTTFLPSADVAVSDISLPTLVRISLQDTGSATTINAELAVSF